MKKLLICLALLITAVVMSACEESEIYYEGKLRPVSQVEEMIADQLEIENPDLDLEINIYKDTEE